MAYPATTKTLGDWLTELDKVTAAVLTMAQDNRSLSASGALTVDRVLRFYDYLKLAHVLFTTVASVPGIVGYVQTEKEQPGMDVVAEFLAMRTQVESTIGWIQANLPQADFGGNSYALAVRLPADFTTPATPLTFTAAQTAPYRTVLNALIATIT